MSQLPYSDLEVVVNKAPEVGPEVPPKVVYESAPEVVPGSAFKSYYGAPEVVPGDAPQVVPGSALEVVPYHKEDNNNSPTVTSEKSRFTCGLSSKSYWLIFRFGVLVVVIAIAGGITGGVVGSRNKSSMQSTDTGGSSTSATIDPEYSSYFDSFLSSTPTTSTPTTAVTPTAVTSTVVLSTTTLLRDCPSSNGTLYDVADGSSEPLTFRKFCTAGLRHVLNGDDLLNQPTKSLNDCINACADYNNANKTAIAAGNNQTCNAVCWRNTDQLNNPDQIPGQCFGYTTLNSSTGFAVTDEVLCDSAAWINQRDL
ncbi:hypothetical protein F5Y12DRAFT_718064 [Xylaria sp. FL1777]|nr:hypothetical protein F5Y12DRAFT_718064 [Xylaria sp. FL1777]